MRTMTPRSVCDASRPGGKASAKRMDPIDRHVGLRLRLRREMLGITQGDLGAALGVSFQQVQKYERGSNRMTASRLYDAAQTLGVGIVYFFEDLPPAVLADRREGTDLGVPLATANDDPATSTKNVQLLADLSRLRPAHQQAVRDLVEALHRAPDPAS